MDSTEALQAILARLDAIEAGTPKRFLSIASAAAWCDLSQDSIRRLIERGELTAHRPVRGKVLVDRQQLEQYVLGSAREVRGSRGCGLRR